MHPTTFAFIVIMLAAVASASFTPEPSCNAQGGQCILEKDCPHAITKKGLCPKQQSQGAECCNGISKSAVTCKSRGGECSANCPQKIRDPKATDCGSEKHCCIWL